MSYSIDSGNADRLANQYNGNISIISVSDLDWGLGNAVTAWTGVSVTCNDTTIPCYSSVHISSIGTGLIDLSIASSIDEKVDGGDGAAKGKFRWYQAAGYNILALIYAPYPKP